MDTEKLLEALLPFLERLLTALSAAGAPGVGVSPMMGHLPGLHEELGKLRVLLDNPAGIVPRQEPNRASGAKKD